MIIVDTNVIVYLYVQGKKSADAKKLLQIDSDWIVPPLWISEFRNAVIQTARHGVITFVDAEEFTLDALKFLEHRTIKPNSKIVINLAQNSNCSAYDCEFIALAQSLNTKLITVDKRVLRNFPQIAIELTTYINQNQ